MKKKKEIVCKFCGSLWREVYQRRKGREVEYYIYCHRCNKEGWIGKEK